MAIILKKLTKYSSSQFTYTEVWTARINKYHHCNFYEGKTVTEWSEIGISKEDFEALKSIGFHTTELHKLVFSVDEEVSPVVIRQAILEHLVYIERQPTPTIDAD